MFDNNKMEPLEPRSKPRPVAAHMDEIAKQHNLYTNDQMTMRGPARVYFADYQQRAEVMRAHDNRISTKHDDRHTISAMLDLAQSRGWDRVKLSGSQEFKREAWVQAQVRGIETEGYTPRQTDIQEAARRQEVAKPAERSTEHAATNGSAKPDVATERAEPPTVRREATVETEATPRAQPQTRQRQEEAQVWNVVEKQGSDAHAWEGAKPAAEAIPPQKQKQQEASAWNAVEKQGVGAKAAEGAAQQHAAAEAA